MLSRSVWRLLGEYRKITPAVIVIGIWNPGCREEYKEFHAGYDRRIADRQRQLGKLKDERSQAMENSSGNIEWIEQFKKYRYLTELDRECIVHLIEKILIYDGKRIEVCFRYRDELENALQYIERFEDVLPAEEGVTMPERRNA